MRKPKVLIVDDEDASSQREAIEATGRVEVMDVGPEQVDLATIKEADLVLVDYDLRDWDEIKHQPLARRPVNGLALIPVLREALRESDPDPPAFAILTNELQKLAGLYLPDDYREHALAKLHNLEWAFDKNDPERSLGTRIADLAEAVRDLSRNWPEDRVKAFAELGTYLAVDGIEPDEDSPLFRAIAQCKPPIHEFSQSSHGISVLRWLLHRILPYPTFLISRYELAERLGIDPTQLAPALDASKLLCDDLEVHRYRGALSTFLGERWWAEAISGWFWELTDGRSPTGERLRAAIAARYGIELMPSAAGPGAVLVYDEKLNPRGQLAAATESVRIEPDDWPPFARYAHALKSDLEQSDLLRLIAVPEEPS